MKRLGISLGIMSLAGLIGLSVLIGSAALASGGTTLCKSAESPCSAENHYATGTTLVAFSTAAEILTTSGNVICEKSGFGVNSKTTSTGSNATSVLVNIESYFFSGCRIQTPSADHACTVTVLNGPYTGTISHIAKSQNGTLTVSNSGSGNMAAKVDCGASLLKCEFAFGTPSLEVFGSSFWWYRANRVKLTGTVYEGGVCPKEATWYGDYNSSNGGTPNALYIEDSA